MWTVIEFTPVPLDWCDKDSHFSTIHPNRLKRFNGRGGAVLAEILLVFFLSLIPALRRGVLRDDAMAAASRPA